MKRSTYMWLLLIVILYFLGLTFQLPNQPAALFVKELYFTFLLLIIAAIGLYSVASDIRLGWFIFTIFFAAGVLNTIYLYLFAESSQRLSVAMIVLGLVGIAFSLKGSGRCHRCHERPTHRRREEKPQTIIVEDLESENQETATEEKPRTTTKKTTKKTAKKSAKKTTKKKAGRPKKTTKKTTAKKKTSRSPAKKTTRKSSKKTASKKTAAKKSTAKKSTAKKKTAKKKTSRSQAKKTTRKSTKKTRKR